MSAQNGTLLWLVEMQYAKIRSHSKAEHLKAQHGEMRIYVLKTELQIDASKIMKE